MDALRTVAAGLGAGECATWHNRDSPGSSGYGPNLDNPSFGAANSQGSICHFDPTNWRAYGQYDSTGFVWEGYKVNNAAGYSSGVSTINIDTGIEGIYPEMTFCIANCAGKYTISAGGGIPDGGAGSITFTPTLSESIADDARIRFQKRGERIIHWGHSHTAQSNSWPSWTVWEAHDDVWKNLPYYRHFHVNDTIGQTYPDLVLEDIIHGNFHQDGIVTFDPANQVMYRGMPAAGPMSRVNMDEYNPLNIGKFTDFALSGTLSFTNGSRSVVGIGTLFESELADASVANRIGYQLWINGYNLHVGVSQNIASVLTIEDDTHLTLTNPWWGDSESGESCSAHNAYDLITHWNWEPTAVNYSYNSNEASAIAHWPERDSILRIHGLTGTGIDQAIEEKRTGRGDSNAWTQLVHSDTHDFDATDGGTYSSTALAQGLHYNTKRRKMLACVCVFTSPHTADGDDGAQLWELALADPSDPQGSVTCTPLDRIPFPFYYNGTTGGIISNDPVTGKYLIWSGVFSGTTPVFDGDPITFYELDPDASPGNQLTELDGSIFPSDMSSNIQTNHCYFLQSCVAHKYGVVVLLGNRKSVVYKHTANDWAENGMPSSRIEDGAGVWGAFPFGDGFVPKYTWDANQATTDSAMAAAVSGLTLYNNTEFNLKISCWSAHPDAPRENGGDGVCMPVIDTSIKYNDQSGSLRMGWRDQTGRTTGQLMSHMNGNYGPGVNHTDVVNPTTDGRARKLYARFPMRVDATVLSVYNEHTPSSIFVPGIATLGVDSAVVQCSGQGAPGVEASWVGKTFYVDYIFGSNWKYGFYTIESVNATLDQVTLNESPSNTGTQATGGSAWIEPDAGTENSGTKTLICHGNPPHGFSASQSIETTSLLLGRPSTQPLDRYMELYGLVGGQGFSNQGFGGPMIADQWHLYEMEMQLRPSCSDFYTEAGDLTIIKSDTIDWTQYINENYIYFDGYGPRSRTEGASLWVPGTYAIDGLTFNTTALTGTVTFTEDSTAVTGSGTQFLSEVAVGDIIKRTSHNWAYFSRVASIESNTALTLVASGSGHPYYQNYRGASGSGSAVLVPSADIPSAATGLKLTTSPTPSGACTGGQGTFSTAAFGDLTKLTRNRVRLWWDGCLSLEYENMHFAFAAYYPDVYGYGSFDLSNASNWRDTTYVHPDAYTYFGHLIFSTQPIPFETAVTSDEPTEPEEPAHLRRPRRVFVV